LAISHEFRATFLPDSFAHKPACVLNQDIALNEAWLFLRDRYPIRRQCRRRAYRLMLLVTASLTFHPDCGKIAEQHEQNTPGGNVNADIKLNQTYVPSDDIVARDIEGEMIIVPLVAGIGDMEDELFTLNDTGKDIWRKLDGKTTLAGIAQALAAEYSAQSDEIERDVIGLVEELVRRKILVAKPDA